jgi:O-antigen ligase
MFLFNANFNSSRSLLKLDQLLLLIALGSAVAKVGSRLTWAWLGLPLALIWTSLLVLGQFVAQHSTGLWILGERTFSLITPGISRLDLGTFGEYLRPYATFSHPNSLAGFLLVGVFLVSALKYRYPLWLTALSVSLSTLALFLSASRSVILTGALLLSLTLLRKIFSLFQIIIISLAIFLFLFVISNFKFQISNFSDLSLARRQDLIKFSLVTFTQNPIFGVGLNNFIPTLGYTLPSPNYPAISSPVLWLQPVHNVFLLILVETGLFGFSIFIYFLWSTLKILFNSHFSLPLPAGRQGTFHLFLCLSFTAIILTSLFDHYWFTLVQNQLLASIVFALIWANKT